MSSKPTALDKVINDPTEHQYDDAIKAAARRELQVLRELAFNYLRWNDHDSPRLGDTHWSHVKWCGLEKATDAYRLWLAEQEQQT